MSYTALYRKFRPNVFDDVKGQEHIVRTLKNQVKSGRVGHAYIFCGTRGTGKTTIAKILAKAVNCENPIDGSPCNECAMCRTIARQASMNVIEIDAASNNGVDNVREIINEVKYSPTEGKYKVYIIDEAHMLSAGAHNALLKTLEEPPEYVIFILATTEVHSIPITILSRCQRYDFHRIDINTISERLLELTGKEGLKVEERAVRYVAKAADGSMRDALSLLDQCIAYHYGEVLTYDKVLEILGAVDLDIFHRILNGVINKDVTLLLGIVEEVIISGKELGRLVTEYTWYLRNLLVLKSSEGAEEMVDASSEDMEIMKEDAGRITFLELIRDIQIFSELSGRLKYAVQKRALLEVALVRLCIPQMDLDVESLHLRVKEIERQLSQGVLVQKGEPGIQREGLVKGGEGLDSESGPDFQLVQDSLSGLDSLKGSKELSTVEYGRAVSEEVIKLCHDWKSIVRFRLEAALRSCTDYSVLEPDPAGENCVQLKVMYKIVYDILKESQEKIQKVLEDYVQKKINLNIVLLSQDEAPKGNDRKAILDKIQSNVNFPVDVE